MGTKESTTGKTILVVDDDPSFLAICRAVLSKSGYSVITATDGSAGLTRLRQERPDAVILDYMMTTPNEGSLVSWLIKEDPELQRVPVILVTSVGSDHPWWNVRSDRDELPVDSWLDKPVAPERLLAEIGRLIERPIQPQ